MPYFPEQHVFFIHIPKTGGTSCLKELQRRYPDSPCELWTPWETFCKIRPVVSQQHFFWSEMKPFLFPSSFPLRGAAIVRDPVKRLESEYRYLKYHVLPTGGLRFLSFPYFAFLGDDIPRKESRKRCEERENERSRWFETSVLSSFSSFLFHIHYLYTVYPQEWLTMLDRHFCPQVRFLEGLLSSESFPPYLSFDWFYLEEKGVMNRVLSFLRCKDNNVSVSEKEEEREGNHDDPPRWMESNKENECIEELTTFQWSLIFEMYEEDFVKLGYYSPFGSSSCSTGKRGAKEAVSMVPTQ